jgi:hypothetical protein
MDSDELPRTATAQWIGMAAVAVPALILIVLGVWALGGAIYFAWGLFRDPDSIAYFAQYFLETTKIATLLPAAGDGVAHYLAWITVILLLLLLGKLGAWAVGAGAQLLAASRR